jgi:hypothetical protein
LFVRPGRGQEEERIEISRRFGRHPDAEVHGGHCVLGVAAPASDSDRGSVGDGVALGDQHRPEVQERDREPVCRLDRDRATARGHRPREGDRPCRSGKDRGTLVRADVDAAVLARSELTALEGEGLQHRPIHGPGPGERGHSADQERDESRKQNESSHVRPPPLLSF